MSSKRSLKQLLEEDVEMDVAQSEESETQTAEGMCVECTDTPEQLRCEVCDENFCRLCFDHLHRTGKRKAHKTVVLVEEPQAKGSEPQETGEQQIHPQEEAGDLAQESTDSSPPAAKFLLNTKFIPMRLTFAERKYFRLLEAALSVSEYTDKVDIYGKGSRAKRILAQLREMCTVLTGLVVANDMDEGKLLVGDKDFAKHQDWFKMVFEIGRRYKIMNPERMRDSFGKLMYMIMDSRLPEISDALEFDLYTPIKTVHSFLEQHQCLGVLDDPLVATATQEIEAGRPRHEIQRDIRLKENAVERLAQKYASRLHKEDIRQILYSISDYHAYIYANRLPVQKMAKRLVDNFESGNDTVLGIAWGQSGARLTHSHTKQYQYVLQSLMLWSEIMRDMYMLWKLADDDMCSKNRYDLCNTGQGLNRLKPCPKVGRAMYNIINNVQQKTGSWMGSSVVHLGDTAVPNALFFLDKYLQVPRILNPINIVLNHLGSLENDKYLTEWVTSQFGSLEGLEKTIMVDFFRHAFDGSGADNFYDAGSCIDGRLTSAWNWANSISKKPYYNFFLVSGFTGFDGSDGF